METLDFVLAAVTSFCFMSKLDLEDAYLTYPIFFPHCKLLKFQWNNQTYMYIVMPFGLAEVPRKFTKAVKVVLTFIRGFGIVLFMYIDDAWIYGLKYEQCWQNTLFTARTLVKVGFLINMKKSVWIPSQIIEFLGFIIDSRQMVVYLSDKKSKSVLDLCQQLLDSESVTIRFLCKVIGKLISIFRVLPLGQAHYRTLERCKLHHLRKNRWNYNAFCSLDFKCFRDLSWWIKHVPAAQAPITRPLPSQTLYVDAYDQSWGAYFRGVKARGHFNQQELSFSINTKETLAVWYGLLSFHSWFTQGHILVRSIAPLQLVLLGN